MSNPALPAEPLPESGIRIFERGSRIITLGKHTLAGEEAPTHFLRSHEASADILRAFGGDLGFLDRWPPLSPSS